MSEVGSEPKDPTQVARELAAALNAADCEYALGGAIALGFWAEPRGTLDVDLTLFLPVTQPSSCVRLLQNIGCEVRSNQAIQSLTEHGFCQVEFGGRRVDIFLPLTPFYEQARLRRQKVILGDQPVMIWDAETLCVFKMMFFRRKDLADVEQVLRVQIAEFNTQWVREQLVEMYGKLDPRIAQWDELVSETN